MVAHANRDEALTCLRKAKEAMLSKDEAKMRKFVEKAKRLDPDCDVASFLSESNGQSSEKSGYERSYSHDDHYEDPNLRQRRRPSQSPSHASSSSQRQKSKSRSPGHRAPSPPETPTDNSDTAATAEQRVAVERIRHCKDYYEILQVSKDSSDVVLKKRYREMALKLHPDKCKIPGATEAFKALGNAYAVLSDSKRRADYDKFGSESDQAARRRTNSGFGDYEFDRGFETEMSPEDIFEMFFGGGFPTGAVHRRNRTRFYYQRETHDQQSFVMHLLHMLPIIVLLFGGLFMQMFVGDPSYMLTREGEYINTRVTRDLRVPYYVKRTFEKDYSGKIAQIEAHVENEYINQLRMKCYQERNNRDAMFWTAKMRSDNEMWKKAQSMQLPSCNRLNEVMA